MTRQVGSRFTSAAAVFSALLGVFHTAPAEAFPGFFAGKDGAERTSRSTQVAIMKNDGRNVVSVMTDYTGPMKPFLLVMPVPKDVKLSEVKVLKRGDLERLEQLTAPRFHEFWEMDPCAPGKAQQSWEVSLAANSNTDFLGGGDMFKNTEKVPKEMKLKVEPTFRDDAEYELSLVGSGITKFLNSKGYKLPEGVESQLDELGDMQFLVAEVDPRRVELGPKGDALLSPIRYATSSEVKIRSTLGLAHLKDKQELLLYVFDPEDRYEVGNYKNAFPPTNLHVDFKVKERIGEYYAAIHDRLLEKDKDTFLVEYAWNTAGCGEPCPNAPIHLHELLTLGGDYFEQFVSGRDKEPEPPARGDEEAAKYQAAKKEEKKRMDELAAEVARRKALVERQGKYMLTRLHHRYGKDGLSKDIELKPGSHVIGGVDAPKGETGELPLAVGSGDESRLQTRYSFLHYSKGVNKCENPESFRWGKPPRTYRGARKIWVADQLAGRDRTRLKPEEVTYTAVEQVGIKGVPNPELAPKDKTEAGDAEKDKSSCDCGVIADTSTPGKSSLGLLLAALGVWSVRRRKSLR